MQPQQTVLKTVTDIGAYTVAGLSLAQILPAVASLFSIIWLSIQIAEKVMGMPFVEILKCLWRRVFK